MTTTDHSGVRGAVITYDEIDSTNSEAMRRVAAGERGPLWILAHRQTAGRGRSGRAWASPKGNFSGSLIFEPGCAPAIVPQLSLLAGIAVHRAIEAMWPEGAASRRLRLKWPNDLLIDGAKVAGILVESTNFGAGLVAVVGIGTNIRQRPDVADRGVTCLAAHSPDPPTVDQFHAILAACLSDCLQTWQSGTGFEALRVEWLARAGSIGDPIAVNTGSGPVAGTFAGLDTDGALLLCAADDRLLRFTFGDVTLNTTLKV
jgi:BirA family transcriptional regulator, biotin operon repressor / biotin---[acetyl-CoA-carboxylase] ligase